MISVFFLFLLPNHLWLGLNISWHKRCLQHPWLWNGTSLLTNSLPVSIELLSVHSPRTFLFLLSGHFDPLTSYSPNLCQTSGSFWPIWIHSTTQPVSGQPHLVLISHSYVTLVSLKLQMETFWTINTVWVQSRLNSFSWLPASLQPEFHFSFGA